MLEKLCLLKVVSRQCASKNHHKQNKFDSVFLRVSKDMSKLRCKFKFC